MKSSTIFAGLVVPFAFAMPAITQPALPNAVVTGPPASGPVVSMAPSAQPSSTELSADLDFDTVDIVYVIVDADDHHTITDFVSTKTIYPAPEPTTANSAPSVTSQAPEPVHFGPSKAPESAPSGHGTQPGPVNPSPTSPLDKTDPTRDDGGEVSPGNRDLVEKTGWIDPRSQLFQDMSVYHHNVHRFNHSAPAVVWNDTLAKFSQEWAELCIDNEEDWDRPDGIGQNIAMGTFNQSGNPSMFITGQWYNSEIENFPHWNQDVILFNETYFNGWGHFSQVVWNDTLQVGCFAKTNCPGFWTTVAGCTYYPPGNIPNHFTQVHSPMGRKTIFPNGEHKMAGN